MLMSGVITLGQFGGGMVFACLSWLRYNSHAYGFDWRCFLDEGPRVV